MERVTATTLRNNLGDYIERARREPVMIERNGHDIVVLLDAEEYKRLAALAKSAQAENTRLGRLGFAKGTFGKLENVTDKSHLEHFSEYMP